MADNAYPKKSRIVQIVGGILMLLALGGLLMADLQGFSRAGLTGNAPVAEVGPEKITLAEFDSIYQRHLVRENINRADAWRRGVPQRLLQSEINARMVAMAARDLGLLVDDARAAKEIRANIQPLREQGMSEQDAMTYLLRGVGVNEAQLVNAIKSQVASDTLFAVITNGMHVPDQMLQDAMGFRHESRRGSYFVLTEKNIVKPPAASEETLRGVYEQTQAAYMSPETRSFAVLVLDRKAFGLPTGITRPTDVSVREYYEANKEKFMTAAGRELSQVIVQDEDAANKVYALAAADGLKAAADAGKHRVITATYTEADLPEELAAAYAAGDNEVLKPIRSALGYHILQAGAMQPARQKPFEAVKAEIIATLSRDTGGEALHERVDEIDNMLADGRGLADIAELFDLKERIIDNVTADAATVADIPMFDKVLQTAFTLDVNETSMLIEAGDAYVIAETRQITPAAPRPFAAVRKDVEKAYNNAQIAMGIDRRVGAVMERINLGESFDKIAKAEGVAIRDTGFIRRGQTPEETKLDIPVMTMLFAIERPGQVVPVRMGDRAYILRLQERKAEPADKTAAEKDAESLRFILSQALRNDILEQYRLHLLDKYKVRVFANALEGAYAPRTEADMYE